MAIQSISLGINEHDDKDFFFNLADENGSPVPFTDFTDIVFIISMSISSPALITKSVVGGTITQSDTAQALLTISSAESGALQAGSFYCEIRGILNGPIHQTMGAGSFAVLDTHIGDTP